MRFQHETKMSDDIRLYLELPGELVVIQAPRVNTLKEPQHRGVYEATQLPFPPTYDTSGESIPLWKPEKNPD